MDRTQKAKTIDDLHTMFENNELVVVTHYSGLTVAEISNLRAQMREAGANFKVTKNTLALRAMEGTQFEGLKDMFAGPTGMAVSQDPVSAAKVAYNYAKGNDKLVLLGGSLNGEILDKSAVEALAKLPSLDELRAKLIAIVSTPATRIATIAQVPASQVARVIGAYAEKG